MKRTTTGSPITVGIIGAGVISARYLLNASRFPHLTMVAIADIDAARAESRAVQHGIRALSVDELLADPGIDTVVNLTVPAAHADVTRAALLAGKHVYSEKPLATDRDLGRDLVRLAADRGLKLGCAPDTFLGAGLQAARAALDAGAIGKPVAATAFMASFGPESWHPDPAFFYAPGAGPLFDIGPYSLTMLVHLFGPIRAVSASAISARSQRPIGSGPRRGQLIDVRTPTHVSAHLEFDSGPVATLLTSFDVPASRLPRGEVYGTEGTLALPDPNTFGGPVQVRRHDDDEWHDVPLDGAFEEESRGLGLADMLAGHGGAHRASGDLALHVLDAMQSILEAASARAWRQVATTCERPDVFSAELVS